MSSMSVMRWPPACSSSGLPLFSLDQLSADWRLPSRSVVASGSFGKIALILLIVGQVVLHRREPHLDQLPLEVNPRFAGQLGRLPDRDDPFEKHMDRESGPHLVGPRASAQARPLEQLQYLLRNLDGLGLHRVPSTLAGIRSATLYRGVRSAGGQFLPADRTVCGSARLAKSPPYRSRGAPRGGPRRPWGAARGGER